MADAPNRFHTDVTTITLEPGEIAMVYHKDGRDLRMYAPMPKDGQMVANSGFLAVTAVGKKLMQDEAFFDEMVEWITKSMPDTIRPIGSIQ